MKEEEKAEEKVEVDDNEKQQKLPNDMEE